MTTDTGAEYGFNVLFLRRFWRLHRVFFPACLSVNSGLFLLLLLTSALEQYLAYEVGIIAGATRYWFIFLRVACFFTIFFASISWTILNLFSKTNLFYLKVGILKNFFFF
jgi:hypothetical protein